MTRDSRRFLQPEAVSRIARLELQARNVVEGFLSGLHRSPYFGQSVEFTRQRGRIAHVACDADRPLPDFSGECFERLPVPRDQCHACTGGCQPTRDSGTDAARRARHDGNATGERRAGHRQRAAA